jgi:tRNA U34 5-carboxymethylaminomethyl modifying enzyme MnmG/GidA
MAMKTNININKMPFALSGDPDQLLTMKNIIKKITGNEVALYMPKKIKSVAGEPVECKVLNTGAEYLADKMNDSKMDYISSLLTYLGLDNVSVEKRERLNTTEAGANDEHIKSNLYLKLKCRQEDWDKVNKMLGTNVRVDINYDFIENFKYEMEDELNKQKEGDING